ncbi:MAG: hypothetical protein KIH63_004655 [Candidatus Saccharibacteria bacterium]|nr:hypothetical protein [Candidatus Saccharibacteria bacterium]
MKKLTKEQAEYLLSIFGGAEFGYAHFFGSKSAELCLNYKQAVNLIHEATEQEFPSFKLVTSGSSINVLNMCSEEGENHVCNEAIFIKIHNSTWNQKAYIIVNPEEFKEFTANCNKIVKWLEEQSDNHE